MVFFFTKYEVSRSTEGKQDEEDGARTEVTHGTGVCASTGALHPDFQGLICLQTQGLNEGHGLIWTAVIVHHGQWPFIVN